MNLWDKKAKNYARYNKELDNIQKETFKELTKLNIYFKNKNIVDIGCGTGVWTLHLAKDAKEITAIDSAQSMLEFFKEDALSLNLNNIKFENVSFKEWIQKNQGLHFDIAFLSMSPALQTFEDYEHFMNLADVKIYLGWADYRKSDFLDPIFEHFKTEFKGFHKQDLEFFLKEKTIKFHKFLFNETRQAQRIRQEALENALWHLSMNGIDASKDELEKWVKSDIIETIQSKIKLLIF